MSYQTLSHEEFDLKGGGGTKCWLMSVLRRVVRAGLTVEGCPHRFEKLSFEYGGFRWKMVQSFSGFKLRLLSTNLNEARLYHFRLCNIYFLIFFCGGEEKGHLIYKHSLPF